MNRRELLKRGFELGAAGLLLPMVEPIRRYWSLDRTMVPSPSMGGKITHGGPTALATEQFPNTVIIGDYTWYQQDIEVERGSIFAPYDAILIGGERMYVQSMARSENSAHTILTVLRGPAYAAN